MGQADDHKGPCWLSHTCAHAGESVEMSIAETHVDRVPSLPSAWICSPSLDLPQTQRIWMPARSQATQHIIVQVVLCPSSAVWP